MKTYELTDAHIAKMKKSELRTTLHKLNPFAGYASDYGAMLNVKQLRMSMTAYRDSDKKTHEAKRTRELNEVRKMINDSGDVIARHDKSGKLVSVETEQTLHDALLSRGYTHRPSTAFNARDIVDASGNVVYTGSASETWAWLRRRDRAAKRASKRAS